jgi:endonuclease/exonuclease/phosphatase (EEP) superfamily protein YafD
VRVRHNYAMEPAEGRAIRWELATHPETNTSVAYAEFWVLVQHDNGTFSTWPASSVKATDATHSHAEGEDS